MKSCIILPHAREWANAGSITINKWLRYPFFPYNFDLLYTACLTLYIFYVLPHLIHSTAGLLILIGTYRIALIHFNRQIALLAALILLLSLVNLDLFYSAYIDLGLALFTFFAFYCAYLAYGLHKNNFRCFCIAAFLLGLARVGTKYQALIFIAPFAFMVLSKKRKLFNLLGICFCFLVPCIYWYLRNWFITGNPVEPLAGSIFGYYSWNQEDMTKSKSGI